MEALVSFLVALSPVAALNTVFFQRLVYELKVKAAILVTANLDLISDNDMARVPESVSVAIVPHDMFSWQVLPDNSRTLIFMDNLSVQYVVGTVDTVPISNLINDIWFISSHNLSAEDYFNSESYSRRFSIRTQMYHVDNNHSITQVMGTTRNISKFVIRVHNF